MEAEHFQSKVFIVTGGGGGIGLAVVSQLLNLGAFVCAVDVHQNKPQHMELMPKERLVYQKGDVRDRKRCREVVTSVVAQFGRLDGLVNNAGVCPLEGEMPADDIFNQVVDVNLRGVWNMGAEALEQMKMQGSGTIVNISSTCSINGAARLPGYTASKSGVAGLTKTWALDFAKYGIRVNCISPGPTDTNMARSPLQTVMGPKYGGGKTDDELLALVASGIPLKRIGTPDEVANGVLFFLSDLASFITGQDLYVSGGHV